MDIALSIGITLLLTLVHGFCSAAEMAIVSSRRAALEADVDEDVGTCLEERGEGETRLVEAPLQRAFVGGA